MSTIQAPERLVTAMRSASESAPFQPKKQARSYFMPVTLLIVLAVAFGAYAYFQRTSGSDGTKAADYQVARVNRGTLRVKVIENGNVESARNEDIKCMVAGGSTILWIVEQGMEVKKGDDLVKLDASVIEEQLTQQKIAYEKARASRIQAEEDLAVKIISIREYLEGTYFQQLQTLESNIVIAKENLKSAENSLEHAERMFRKGYVNELQLETNRFAVQRSQLDLASAETAKKVLVDFTKAKTVKELESARDTASAKLLGEKSAEELEKYKLDRLKEQLNNCVIKAPQPGIVVYNNEMGWRGNQAALIEEGAKVRESQTLIKLPDLHFMQVKALIHESKIDLIEPGMKSLVEIRDQQTLGTVISVSSQPEAGRWGASAVKEYATIVQIDDTSKFDGLKPGMTAKVEILVKELKDVIVAPLLAVVEVGGEHFCWIQTPKGPEKRKVVIGISNDTEMAIRDGLADGDVVILNPRATIAEAREMAGTSKVVSKSIPYAPGTPKGGAGAKDLRGKTAADATKPGELAGDKSGIAKGDKEKAKKKAAPSMPTFASLDANKDGKLTKEELPERMQQAFDFIDTNKDGKIDAKEYSEAIARFRQMQQQQQQPGGGGGPGGGSGGPKA